MLLGLDLPGFSETSVSREDGAIGHVGAYHQGVWLDFSRPSKPTDNSFVETFNGSLRDECLNDDWPSITALPKPSS